MRSMLYTVAVCHQEEAGSTLTLPAGRFSAGLAIEMTAAMRTARQTRSFIFPDG